jgi:hypothetical protein
MNFSDIYKKIRSIDEAAPTAPTAPTAPQATDPAAPTEPYTGPTAGGSPTNTPAGINRLTGKPIALRNTGMSWDEMSPEEQQAFVAKQKADRAAAAAAAQTPNRLQNNVTPGGAYTRGLEEDCGDMMPHSPAQPDNVDMNVTLHGSGPGGIRDLMSILRDIEGKDSNGGIAVAPHADDLEIMVGDMEEEYGNSAPGATGPQTASIQAVTNVGSPINSGDSRPRQAGLPQGHAHPMHETVKSKLQQQYDTIKQEGAFDDIADTKLGDMPGKLAAGAKRAYDNAATKVGKAATAVGNTTPREIGQKIGQGISKIAQKAKTASEEKFGPVGVINDKFPKSAGQPSGNHSEQTGMRESTDFARVKHLNKILNG